MVRMADFHSAELGSNPDVGVSFYKGIAMNYELINGLRVKIERSSCGLWFATSPDRKGLIVAEKTKEATIDKIPKVCAALDEAEIWWDNLSMEEKEAWIAD